MNPIRMLALVALVAACQKAPMDDSDGVDRRGQAMVIRVTTYPTLEALNFAAAEFAELTGHPPLEHVNGWSAYDGSGLWCEIHVLDLRWADDTERQQVWGHELAHCVHGRYHR